MEKFYKIAYKWSGGRDSPYVSFWSGADKSLLSDPEYSAGDAAHGGDFSIIKKSTSFRINTELTSKGMPFKKQRALCDFPFSSGSGTLLSMRANKCLSSFLVEDAYLHPVTHKETGDNYVRMFATKFVDGLINLDKSKYITYPSSGRIQVFESMVFNEDVSFPSIFKLTEKPRGDTYFSQAFVDRYSECGLTGVEFIDVTTG